MNIYHEMKQFVDSVMGMRWGCDGGTMVTIGVIPMYHVVKLKVSYAMRGTSGMMGSDHH